MCSVIQPPMIGPLIGASVAVIDHTESAMPAPPGPKVASSSDCDTGTIGPDTRPCSTRKATSAVEALGKRRTAATRR